MMTKGVLPSAVIGPMANAFGVQITPVITSTLSRVMSSVAMRLATSGLGPVSSRRMISTFTPGGRSFSWFFTHSLTVWSIISPTDAFWPVNEVTKPIFTVWAKALDAVAPSSAAAAVAAISFANFMILSLSKSFYVAGVRAGPYFLLLMIFQGS